LVIVSSATLRSTREIFKRALFIINKLKKHLKTMFQVHHRLIKERERPFRPSQIKFLGFGISRFNPPLTRPCIDYAEEEYKNNSVAAGKKLRA
jgi:hypothetical protein